MSAILCHNCKKLISSEETSCPYCQSSQLPAAAPGLRKAFFHDANGVISLIFGTTVFFYIVTIAGDLSSAMSMQQGIFGIGQPNAKFLYLLGMTGGAAWKCGHYWTVLTATFLHGSLLHIFFNLSWLRSLGHMTVQFFGPARFTVIYLLTGVSGFLVSNLFQTPAPLTIGASCSIFGLMGVLLVFAKRRGGQLGQNLSRHLWIWVIIGFLLGFSMEGINNYGHAGGFLGGIVMGFLLPKQEGKHENAMIQWLAILLILLTTAGFLLSFWKMWDAVLLGYPVCS